MIDDDKRVLSIFIGGRKAGMLGHIRAIVIVSVALGFAAQVVSRASGEELSVERVLAADRVIDVSISLPADDWTELCRQTRDPGKVFSGATENPFTWFQGDITIDGVAIRSVGIRKKGFLGSLDNQWPSLKVKFDEYVSQAPIPGLDGLTLNNNKQDSSLASQFLAYQLFNAAGVQAPRCNFVRVTVNGEYLGLYSNVESIGKPFLQRRFGNDAGNLYEGTLADFYPKAIDRLEAKTNRKKHDRSRAVKLATLLAADGPVALDEVGQLVDIDNFLRFWAMESLIGFWDGYTNNQNNFWAYESGADGKFYFMPWGADAAFMPPGGFFGFGSGGPVSVYAESMLANRLYQDTATAERYRETMRWLLANVWREADLLKSIDQIEGLVTEHLHRRQAGAPRSLNSVRQFVRGRRAAIEKELDHWPVRRAPRPRKPMYVVEVGSASGSFETTWRETPPANIPETGKTEFKLEIDGDVVARKESGASVHQPKPAGFLSGLGNRSPEEQRTSHVVIAGVREADGKTVTLTLPVDGREGNENIGKPLAVRGWFANGDNRGAGFFMPFGRHIAAGTVTLTRGEFHADGIVAGRFDLKISEMRGGFMDRRRPGPGERGGEERRQPNARGEEQPPANGRE